jgi:hypothetical protein
VSKARELTTEQRIKRRKFRADVCSVTACPQCDSPVGIGCKKNNGDRRKSPHIARVQASKQQPN